MAIESQEKGIANTERNTKIKRPILHFATTTAVRVIPPFSYLPPLPPCVLFAIFLFASPNANPMSF
ncbi:MAG: hypothetical protein IJ706_07835 [Clostridia bacterium]|nr:hypothetical protein [Clostridia bacterium]